MQDLNSVPKYVWNGIALLCSKRGSFEPECQTEWAEYCYILVTTSCEDSVLALFPTFDVWCANYKLYLLCSCVTLIIHLRLIRTVSALRDGYKCESLDWLFFSQSGVKRCRVNSCHWFVDLSLSLLLSLCSCKWHSWGVGHTGHVGTICWHLWLS